MHWLLRSAPIRASLAVTLLLTLSPLPVAGQTAIDTAEFGARRAKLLAMVPDGIAVILGAEEHPYRCASARRPTSSISLGSKSPEPCCY